MLDQVKFILGIMIFRYEVLQFDQPLQSIEKIVSKRLNKIL